MFEKLSCFLLVFVALGGCATASTANSTAVESTPAATATAVAEPQRPAVPGCEPASGTVHIAFEADASAETVAAWFATASCRTVVLSPRSARHDLPQQVERSIEASAIDSEARKLFAEMGLSLAIDGNLVAVFADSSSSAATVDTTEPRVLIEGWAERQKAIALLDDGVTKRSETHYVVKRSFVDNVIANPTIMRGARIVPAIKNGQPSGFKMYAIRENSFFSRIGLKNGDTIHTINGHDLTTPDQAAETYRKVREADRVEIELVRRTQPVTIVIDVE